MLGVVENMRGALTARQTACGADVQYAPCMHRPGGLCAENAVQIRKRCRCDGRRETGVAAHRACIFAVGYARVSLLSRRSQVPDLDALFAQTEARRARSTWRTGARRVITRRHLTRLCTGILLRLFWRKGNGGGVASAIPRFHSHGPGPHARCRGGATVAARVPRPASARANHQRRAVAVLYKSCRHESS